MIFTQNSNSFYFWILNLKGAKPLSSTTETPCHANHPWRLASPDQTSVFQHPARLATRRGHCFLYIQIFSVCSSNIFAFQRLRFPIWTEPVLKQIVEYFKRAWFRTTWSGPNRLLLLFQPDFQTEMKAPRSVSIFGRRAICRFPRFGIRFEIDQARLFQFLLLLNFNLFLYINIVQIFFVSS